PVHRALRHRRATLRGPAVVAAAAPARPGRAPWPALGRGREPGSGRSELQPQPWRARLLCDRPAPGRLASGAAVRAAGAGVQLASPVRPPAGGRALRQDAGRHPRARPGPAGFAQSQPGRFRYRAGDPAVQRTGGGAGLDLPVPGAPHVSAQPAGGRAEEGRIAPCSGHALELATGDELVVIDPMGEQVSDLTAFARDDTAEYLSSGRSIDYASRLWLTTGDVLYSNRSRPMLRILEDTCGRHDFT